MASLESLLAFLGPFQNIAANIGILLVLYFFASTLYFISRNIFVYYFAEQLGKTVNFKELGAWAVVTGATDGIGKGYAFDLARRGCNIVLISRSEDKLTAVAKEIESAYGNIRTKIIVADFTADETIYDKIRQELGNLEIGTLINNVGMGYPYPEYFSHIPGGDKFLLNMIRCNCVAQTMMTRIVLSQMVLRKKGVIVSLSSGAGASPIPLMSVYSATKAYNDFLGRALQQEYEDKGIIFQVIQPYVVATNMSGMRRNNLFVLEPKNYARHCLNSVGYFTRTNGHLSHVIQNFVATIIPACIAAPLVRYGMQKWRDSAIGKLKRKGLYKED